MNSAPDISVVIVNWNTRQMLLDCVESLVATTRNVSVEIIVVDNASSDGSMDALAAAHPAVIRICNTENQGFAKANNQGLRIARGRHLCLVNSDVKALDGVLDKLCAFADANPRVGAVAPRTVGGDMKLRRNCREFPSLRNAFCQAAFLDRMFPSVRAFRGRTMIEYDYATPEQIDVLSGCFLLVRRETIEQVGLLDERFFIYSEDVDWCRRIHQGGWDVMFYPHAEAIHYGGSSAAVERLRFGIEQLKANLQYWRKHYAWPVSAMFWIIMSSGLALRATGWTLLTLVPGRGTPDSRRQASSTRGMLRWLVTTGARFALALRVDRRPVGEPFPTRRPAETPTSTPA